MDSVKASGFTVFFIGVALLLFTFVVAYQLLTGVLEIPSTGGFESLFGGALAPLITYAIRALYLGIMGWIGSILTRRGVQTVTSVPATSKKTEKTSGTKQAGEENKA